MYGELGYLSLVRKIINIGRLSPNRTKVKTLSLFGEQLKFDLRQSKLPMITTKKVSFETILKELLWFMHGDTNQKTLESQGVRIWKANSSREYLDSRGLFDYKEYETLGPIYGFQWRHFGAKYIDSDTDYSGQGIDQLRQVIDMCKNDPTSRRIIMTAWNPMDLDKMALPPCHTFVQFSVNSDTNELSSHMYQRSGDMMLGVPYNITSYSLLTHIVAQLCDLKAAEFIYTLGDVHIYEPHIENAKQQIILIPHQPPTIEMLFDETTDVDTLRIDQFQLKNYKHHKMLHFDMIV